VPRNDALNYTFSEKFQLPVPDFVRTDRIETVFVRCHVEPVETCGWPKHALRQAQSDHRPFV